MASCGYKRLTPLMCARLAAPHTWPGASVLPTVFGGLLSIWLGYDFSWPAWVVLLVCATMAQSSVNVLNDWVDFRAGTDTKDNSDDPSDAVLVYENPNPGHVLALGISYAAVAAACGLGCCIWAGTALPVIIGAVGVLAIATYSLGKTPISYLPLGELVSGVVMSLIMLADVIVFASSTSPAGPFSPSVMTSQAWFVAAEMLVPFILGIGLVMATQNGCDIERDAPIGRRTLAVLMGRKRFVWLYRLLVILWIATVLHLAFWSFRLGFWAAVVVIALGLGTIRGLLVTPLVHEVRGRAMGGIVKANLFVNGALCMAVVMSIVNTASPLL